MTTTHRDETKLKTALRVNAPAGFRLRTWVYEGQRIGMVCNRCGYIADPLDPAAVTQADLDAAAAQHGCPPPVYDWDYWHRRAVAAGVDPELAELGREIHRENYQHDWGMRVDEEAMIRLAKEDPQGTRVRWRAMLDQDGPVLR
jgi:hypothetical protein